MQSENITSGQALAPDAVDPLALFKLSYGLYVLTTRDGEKDNGCIINTAVQVADNPKTISIATNKANFSCDIVAKTGVFNVNTLSVKAPFSLFQQFGFQSGRNVDKFGGVSYNDRSANGIRFLPEFTNGVISGKVKESFDLGSHMLYIADVTQAFVLSGDLSVTYQYYFDHIKPKPQPQAEKKTGYVCKICGYVYEGDPLPADFICPICKHGASDFEKL